MGVWAGVAVQADNTIKIIETAVARINLLIDLLFMFPPKSLFETIYYRGLGLVDNQQHSQCGFAMIIRNLNIFAPLRKNEHPNFLLLFIERDNLQ